MDALPTAHQANRRAIFWGVGVIAPAFALAAWFAVSLLLRVMPLPVAAPGTPQTAGLSGFRDVMIRTADGQRLDAWWTPPPSRGGGIVLFLHGNPGTVAGTAERLADLQHAGLGAMAIDYEGFGRSTGRPSQNGMRRDADTAFDWLRHNAPQSPIAVFGESLGTYPAVALAADRPVAGVLLNAPFASLRELWAIHHWTADPWLEADPFDSAALIGRVKAPLMILEGTTDAIVLPSETLRLFAAAPQPKTIIMVAGAGHVAAYQGAARARALAALVRWTGGGSGAGR